jgi:PAS domain S-box-containing protein
MVEPNDAQQIDVQAKLPRIVYVFDVAERRARYLDTFVLRVLGYDTDDTDRLGGALFEDLLHDEDRARLPELLARWEQATDDEVLETERRLRGADGEYRWFLDRERVHRRDAHGRVTELLGTSVDITTRKLLELRLSRSHKLEALGRLAGGVAHDFNNLLTVVLGCGSLGIAQHERGADPTEALRAIVKAGEQGAALTRQLLTFARSGLVETEVLDLRDVVAATMDLVSRSVGAGVRLDLRLEATGTVRIDRSQLVQLLMNLATNARDAMPAGGVLTVSTGRAGERVMLGVVDDGVGMDEATQKRAFEPFFSTQGEGLGSGLGLSAVW